MSLTAIRQGQDFFHEIEKSKKMEIPAEPEQEQSSQIPLPTTELSLEIASIKSIDQILISMQKSSEQVLMNLQKVTGERLKNTHDEYEKLILEHAEKMQKGFALAQTKHKWKMLSELITSIPAITSGIIQLKSGTHPIIGTTLIAGGVLSLINFIRDSRSSHPAFSVAGPDKQFLSIMATAMKTLPLLGAPFLNAADTSKALLKAFKNASKLANLLTFSSSSILSSIEKEMQSKETLSRSEMNMQMRTSKKLMEDLKMLQKNSAEHFEIFKTLFNAEMQQYSILQS